MKEDINIDELFKQKFENFEGEVDPSVWSNVQQSINSSAAGSAGGLSSIAKVAIVTGIATVTAVSVWYATSLDDNKVDEDVSSEFVVKDNTYKDNETNKETLKQVGESVQVVDTNDPEINQNLPEIENRLNEQHISEADIDNELVESIVPKTDPIEDITVDPNDEPESNTPTEIATEETNSSEQTSSEDDNVEEKEKRFPTGSMEMKMEDAFAPAKVTFFANAKDYDNILWKFSNGTELKGEEVKLTFNRPGEYEVTLLVKLGDEVYRETRMVKIESRSSIDNIPNVITPNGDRRNDEFSINTTQIKTFYISIRDEKGKEMFSSNDKDFVWDGTDQSGNKVEKGIYTYVIVAEGEDGAVFKIPGQLYVQ